MQNCPGVSWGPGHHVNLVRSSIGFLALYYDDEFSTPEIVRVFNPKNIVDYGFMMDLVLLYNYNTDDSCPMVRAELDWVG